MPDSDPSTCCKVEVCCGAIKLYVFRVDLPAVAKDAGAAAAMGGASSNAREVEILV